MHPKNLATYLNDHLAGSVLALELLQHLAETAGNALRESELLKLHREIQSDQVLLKELLEAISDGESVLKKAGAWVAEKLAHLKLRLSSVGEASLGRLEAFEMLSLGIEGKKGLWRSLGVIGNELPVQPALDLDALVDAACSQRDRVEAWRLEASAQAFTGTASGS